MHGAKEFFQNQAGTDSLRAASQMCIRDSVLQAASSAAYSGHFAHALGMIKSAISTAELEGNIMSAQIFRQHPVSYTHL